MSRDFIPVGPSFFAHLNAIFAAKPVDKVFFYIFVAAIAVLAEIENGLLYGVKTFRYLIESLKKS